MRQRSCPHNARHVDSIHGANTVTDSRSPQENVDENGHDDGENKAAV